MGPKTPKFHLPKKKFYRVSNQQKHPGGARRGGPEAPAKVKKEPKYTKKVPNTTKVHQNPQNNHKPTEKTNK